MMIRNVRTDVPILTVPSIFWHACLTSFAPIVTSFSRKVVRFPLRTIRGVVVHGLTWGSRSVRGVF